MKKIYFFFFLMSLCSYSQFKNGVVTYKKTMLEIKKEDQEKLDIFSQNVKKSADLHEYILTFSLDKSKCIFKENLLENDIENNHFSNLAYIISDDYDYYYEKSVIGIKRYNDGQQVQKNNKLDWIITSEEKVIEKYKCYKATLLKKIKNYKGEDKLINITAWFCPELPYSFGPKEYNSLPGLILEVENNLTLLSATKIEFSDKEIEIDFPKGKTITQEEYERKVLSGN